MTKLLNLPVPLTHNLHLLIPRQLKQVKCSSVCLTSD
nr:MAG TPA: hypothetical protein [Caudoviricetes sp.]